MEFARWLELQGCEIEITQEDDGSGYVCFEVRTPANDADGWPGATFDVTVSA